MQSQLYSHRHPTVPHLGCSLELRITHVLPAVPQHLGGGEEEVLPAHLAVVGPLQG